MKYTLLLALILSTSLSNAQKTFTWTQIADYPYSAWGMNFCSDDNNLYTFSNCGGGNNTLYKYNATADKWDTLAKLTGSIICNTSMAAVGDTIYLVAAGSLQLYDIVSDSWISTTISTPTAFKKDGASALVVDTVIYYIGGGAPTSTNLFKYSTNTRTFTQLASMNTARENAQVTLFNDKIYAIGGRKSGSTLDSGEVYDIANDTWTTIPVGFAKRYFGAAISDSSYIYLMGGETGTNSFKYKTIEVFDPVNNTVTILDTMINNMNREHTAYALGISGTKLIAAAGFTNTPTNAITNYCEATDFKTVVNIMKAQKESVDFTIYPNPTNGLIYVRMANPIDIDKIELYNTTGQLVAKRNTNDKKEITIDCSMLPSGSYVIRAYSKTGTVQAQLLQVTN